MCVFGALQSESDTKKSCRLPTNAKPVNYKLHLTPNLDDFTFTGVCVTTVDVLSETATLACNAKDLTVSSIVADGSVVSTGHVRAHWRAREVASGHRFRFVALVTRRVHSRALSTPLEHRCQPAVALCPPIVYVRRTSA